MHDGLNVRLISFRMQYFQKKASVSQIFKNQNSLINVIETRFHCKNSLINVAENALEGKNILY